MTASPSLTPDRRVESPEAALARPPSLTRRVAGTRPPLTPRLFGALVAGKAAATASRLLGRGGGTSLPGMVARRIDPGVLRELVRRQGVPTIAITGSNGKTTTARFTAALLRGEGIPVSHNSAGSNLTQGVTSLAVSFADLRGRLPDGVLVAEVDEGALLVVGEELEPRVLLITDLFRDQLDRFGELHALGDAIATAVGRLPPDSVLAVNGDDPLVASIAARHEGPRITFGFDVGRSLDQITRAADTIRCPRCRHDLEYRAVHLSHMGDFACPGCGFARPPLDVAVTSVEVVSLSETRCTVRTPHGDLELRIPQAGIHVAYNAAAAVAIVVALGVPTTHAAWSLGQVGPAFGRIELIEAGDRQIVLAFAKNPTSYNTTLRSLAVEGEPRTLLTAVSNTLVDGEDFAWLWDVHFEGLAETVERVIASGTRADELANRLKYAGVPPSVISIEVDRRRALERALEAVGPGGRLTILAGYTPTIEFREEMRRRGWTGRYWAV